MQEKTCTQCKGMKALNDFHKNSHSKDGHRSTCKDCHLKPLRGMRKRLHNLRQHYGMSYEQFVDMMIKCDFKCEICHREVLPPHKSMKRSKWALIDHCHKTEEIRGILCIECNHLVAIIERETQIIEKCYTYLKRKMQ
jgi:hypothetical protein